MLRSVATRFFTVYAFKLLCSSPIRGLQQFGVDVLHDLRSKQRENVNRNWLLMLGCEDGFICGTTVFCHFSAKAAKLDTGRG